MNTFRFFFPRSLVAARRFSGAGLFYWATSTHRLCSYWPVSRCAVGREGISPDLPLRAGSRLVGTAGLVSERSWPRGGKSPLRLWWAEKSSNRRLAARRSRYALIASGKRWRAWVNISLFLAQKELQGAAELSTSFFGCKSGLADHVIAPRALARRALVTSCGPTGRNREHAWQVAGSMTQMILTDKEAAACVGRADQRDTRADVVAARRDGGLDLALAWASMRIKLDASLLHLPPSSMPRTTKRHRRLEKVFGKSFPWSFVHPALRRRQRFLPVTWAHLTGSEKPICWQRRCDLQIASDNQYPELHFF